MPVAPRQPRGGRGGGEDAGGCAEQDCASAPPVGGGVGRGADGGAGDGEDGDEGRAGQQLVVQPEASVVPAAAHGQLAAGQQDIFNF